MAAENYRYYADLNCPFCYALHERIAELGMSDRVQWRGVCHMDNESRQTLSKAELQQVVARVARRSPGLELRVPPLLPDTSLPTLVIIDTDLSDPEASRELRTTLYRALWIDGEDISDPKVVARRMAQCGLRYEVPRARAKRIASTWQGQWENGPHQGRLPALVSPTGAVSLGLDEARRTAAFLRSGMMNSFSEESCQVIPD